MAISAYESYVSRSGSSFGVFGGNNLTSTWLVYVDDTTTNPAEWLAANEVPIGSPFPWPAFGLIALQYTIGERKGPYWEVHILYGPPIYLPGQQWRISFRSSLEIEDAFVDRDGFEIGIDWAKTPNGAGADGFIRLADNQVQYLKRNGWFSRPYQRRKRVAQLALTTSVPFLTDGTAQRALSYVGTINSNVFYGFNDKTVMFEGCEIEQRFNVGGEISPEGFVWDVALFFAWNLDGWQPVLREEWLDESRGLMRPVLAEDGIAIRTDFNAYFESDFYALLSEFLP